MTFLTHNNPNDLPEDKPTINEELISKACESAVSASKATYLETILDLTRYDDLDPIQEEPK